MEIPHYIAELLSEHDCVIIPGLGGFVGSYLPAQIHSVYHTFQPPSKKILFNINLRQNDGLLANRIAQAEKISFNEASEQIRHFADETIRALKTRKYLILQNIGKFYMGKEGNIQFDQDLRSNLLPESFGLQPFFSAPVKRDPHQNRIDKRIQSRRETRELVKRAIPKPLKWAAILAIPIGVAIMLSLAGYDSIKSGSWNTADILSSLSPFSKADVKQAPPETHAAPMVEEEVPFAEGAPVEREPTPTQPQTGAPQAGTYAVIVGAFGVENNAHRLVNKLNQKGIKAQIFDRSSRGLLRVATGIFSTQTDAIRMMNTMKANGFPEAWILEK
ncbi:MAG: SPOR domain-containing protein [Bacteroidales bacterium]|nr:SPOR domain-containing protein [Bacteroidales bacterium]